MLIHFHSGSEKGVITKRVFSPQRSLESLGCVIAQAFFSRGASAISLKSRFLSAEFSVI